MQNGFKVKCISLDYMSIALLAPTTGDQWLEKIVWGLQHWTGAETRNESVWALFKEFQFVKETYIQTLENVESSRTTVEGLDRKRSGPSGGGAIKHRDRANQTQRRENTSERETDSNKTAHTRTEIDKKKYHPTSKKKIRWKVWVPWSWFTFVASGIWNINNNEHCCSSSTNANTIKLWFMWMLNGSEEQMNTFLKCAWIWKLL